MKTKSIDIDRDKKKQKSLFVFLWRLMFVYSLCREDPRLLILLTWKDILDFVQMFGIIGVVESDLFVFFNTV